MSDPTETGDCHLQPAHVQSAVFPAVPPLLQVLSGTLSTFSTSPGAPHLGDFDVSEAIACQTTLNWGLSVSPMVPPRGCVFREEDAEVTQPSLLVQVGACASTRPVTGGGAALERLVGVVPVQTLGCGFTPSPAPNSFPIMSPLLCDFCPVAQEPMGM